MYSIFTKKLEKNSVALAGLTHLLYYSINKSAINALGLLFASILRALEECTYLPVPVYYVFLLATSFQIRAYT